MLLQILILKPAWDGHNIYYNAILSSAIHCNIRKNVDNQQLLTGLDTPPLQYDDDMFKLSQTSPTNKMANNQWIEQLVENSILKYTWKNQAYSVNDFFKRKTRNVENMETNMMLLIY